MAGKSNTKKRTYSEDYLKFGFTSIISGGIEKPQCVICSKVLSAESMKPFQLKRHFEKEHSDCKDKDISFFQRKVDTVKRTKLDATGDFHSSSKSALEASYIVSLQIAKAKKPHTIGEELILPCTKAIVRLMIGTDAERKLNTISLSDNTVQRRILDLSEDIKNQVVGEIKESPSGWFCLQLDESTDVASCAQLLVFVRYINKLDFKDEFLFCEQLDLQTRGIDIYNKVSSFIEREGLKYEKLLSICTDGAPAMLGCRSGFMKHIKESAPYVTGNHCMIHREALASKTLPDVLKCVFQVCIKIVNYIKSSALNTRLFQNLCLDMDARHKTLLYHTEVRWLSKGNVLKRLLDLHVEVKEFFKLQNKEDWVALFNDNSWLLTLSYLADIFEKLNILNLSLQGKESYIMDFVEKLTAFQSMLDLWIRKIEDGRMGMFSRVTNLIEIHDYQLPDELRDAIILHLKVMKDEFTRYFPEIRQSDFNLVRNPFVQKVEDCIPDDQDDAQEEFINLINDSGAKAIFSTMSVPQFWCSMLLTYPLVSQIAIKALLPFPSTYLCETGFSSLLTIKTRNRNRLEVEHDLRCCLSKTEPRISQLVEKKTVSTFTLSL